MQKINNYYVQQTNFTEAAGNLAIAAAYVSNDVNEFIDTLRNIDKSLNIGISEPGVVSSPTGLFNEVKSIMRLGSDARVVILDRVEPLLLQVACNKRLSPTKANQAFSTLNMRSKIFFDKDNDYYFLNRESGETLLAFANKSKNVGGAK